MSKKILILGGGAWGCALAIKAAKNFHQIDILIRDKKLCEENNQLSENRKYLPNIKLPKNIRFITNSEYDGLFEYDLLVIAIASEFLFSNLINLNIQKFKNILIATKGLDHQRKQLISKSFLDEYNVVPSFISGPNFAIEVANNIETATLISSVDIKDAKIIAEIFRDEKFVIYVNNDIISTQISGVYKNILAIYSGYNSFLQTGENFKAKFIYEAIDEIGIISEKLGGCKENRYSIAALGDIMISCYTDKSRNFKYGYELGRIFAEKNETNADIVEKNAVLEKKSHYFTSNDLVEGIKSAITLDSICSEFLCDLKILPKICDLIKKLKVTNEYFEK